MFTIEIERADGEVFPYTANGRVESFEDSGDAEYVIERLHYRFAETERYASFRVLDENNEVVSEMEC